MELLVMLRLSLEEEEVIREVLLLIMIVIIMLVEVGRIWELQKAQVQQVMAEQTQPTVT